MDFLYHIIIMIGIYTILALAANIPVGLANLLSLAQAAFYGIGAYLSAFVLLNFNIPLLPGLFVVAITTGFFSLLISLASIRLKGDYFILAALGFQLIVFSVLYNWTDVTKGPYGISGIPPPRLFAFIELTANFQFAILSVSLAALTSFLFYYLVKSPFGRVLKSIRSDELSVSISGRNVYQFKIIAFFLSAGFSASAGFLFAGYVKYIDPTSFTLDESIFILSALFIGGLGNVKGCIVGAAVIVILPELLRFAGLPDNIAANLRQIIYGLALILVMLYFPKGLAGDTMLK
ncbi:MAG: branched-chain amino acid ABC transporter permease [Bacteroidetes bacterium]|nr:branched-chain amino acid ABC transporter permease [Bacteroidota bacterium]